MKLFELFSPKPAPVPVPDGDVVKEMPTGFFRLHFNGKKLLAYNHPAFGLTYEVRSSFSMGGQVFRRDLSVALPVWHKPNPLTENKRYADTDKLESFGGDFQYSPLQ